MKVPPVPDPMPRWYCRCTAVIVDSGSTSPPTRQGMREPYATLGEVIAQDDWTKGPRERHLGRKMPMGWNIGHTFPVGTVGIAEYIKMGASSLWRFTADAEQPDPEVDHRKANFVMALLLHYAEHNDMPHAADFNLSIEEETEMRELVATAISNCGGDEQAL